MLLPPSAHMAGITNWSSEETGFATPRSQQRGLSALLCCYELKLNAFFPFMLECRSAQSGVRFVHLVQPGGAKPRRAIKGEDFVCFKLPVAASLATEN